MAEELPEPDWSLLPDHAQQFFGLQDGFGRTELKRAYNRLLRRYKPERFPAEFQRLRAAYEQLDEVLRYGQATATGGMFTSAGAQPGSGGAQSPSAGEVPDFAPVFPSEPDSHAQAPVFDASAALATRTLEEVRRELAALEPKDPAQWVQLALLTDELQPEQPLAFYDVLIEGVGATSGAVEVVALLTDACREELEPKLAASLVQRLTALIAGVEGPRGRGGFHGAWYYFLTEPLWIGLLERLAFPSFRKVFEACRRKVGEAGFSGYLVLLPRLLRTGAYRADDEWVDEAKELLESRYQELGHGLQEDFDLFELFDRYRPRRQEFLEVHPGRALYDQALVALTRGEVAEADRAFLAAQAFALDRTDELLEAFPRGADDLSFLVEPLEWYAQEVADRRGGPLEAMPGSLASVRVREFLYELERRTDRSAIGRMWNCIGLLLYVLQFALPVLVLLVGFQLQDPFATMFMVLAGGLGLFLLLSWNKGWTQNVFANWTRAIPARVYRDRWRGEVIDFLRATHLDFGMLVHSLATFQDDNVTNHYLLLNALVEDPGVRLFALSLEFAE